MAIECLVITFILGAIVFSFARADRIRWVIATVPLGILPLANCVSCFVCTAFLGCELPKNIAAVILLLAVMASCVWIGIASGFLRTNRMRIPYIYMRWHRLQCGSWAYSTEFLYRIVIIRL